MQTLLKEAIRYRYWQKQGPRKCSHGFELLLPIVYWSHILYSTIFCQKLCALNMPWTVGHQHISLWRYTVRHGTRILTRADQAERQDRYNRWLAEIDPTSPNIPLHRVLTRLWQTNVHNKWKLPRGRECHEWAL